MDDCIAYQTEELKMKCPSCFSTMECRSEIHKVPGQPGRERMDLHCPNRGILNAKTCYAICHMGVITEDPKIWECHEYNFSFKFDGIDYYLQGYNNLVDSYHQHRDNDARTILHIVTFANPNWSSNILLRIRNYRINDVVVDLPFFIPLSTDNDMHERAWDLFHRLRNLIIFS